MQTKLPTPRRLQRVTQALVPNRPHPWTLAAAAALALLAACGGGGGGNPQAEQPPPDSGRAQALAVSKPGELVSFVQQRLRTRPVGAAAAEFVSSTAPPTMAAQPAGGSADAATTTRSSTLVQEAGVDEADLLHSDGNFLYTVQPLQANSLRLQVYQRGASGGVTALKALDLTQPGAISLFTEGLHASSDGKALAVIGQTWETALQDGLCKGECLGIGLPDANWVWMSSGVMVQRVDTSTPAQATLGERLSIEGSLVDSRRIGDTLYVVTTHTPRLPLDNLPATATSAQREAAIAAITAADVLPRVRRNGGAAMALLSDTDCWVQPGNASLVVAITTITLVDLKSPTLAHSSRCVIGGTEAMYMSAGALYLATTRYGYAMPMATALIYPQDMRTDIHKFALEGGSVAYRGSGSVAGHLGWDGTRKSYRFSEHNGDLRVLSFTGPSGWFTIQDAASMAASPATLSVLRERASDQSLQLLATLPNERRSAPLGKPGEQVYAVRFAGERGYVVTFRRTDPLYVLDLSNPADPQAVGELQVNGYSEQLVPLAGGLLLGVGREADSQGMLGGIQVSLFDVANPAAPRQLASHAFGGPFSSSATDYTNHGLNLFAQGSVVRGALPVNLSPPGPTFAPGGWQSLLQRFEVDTTARTLNMLPVAGAASSDSGYATWLDRSVQIGEQAYYLSGGRLAAYAW